MFDPEVALLTLPRTRPDAGSFDPDEVADLAEPVRRYFTAALAPGVTRHRGMSLRMTGQIKLRRWVGFRGTEVVAPLHGFVWRARAMGLITGHDGYAGEVGAMHWTLLGLVPVMTAHGPDIARSAAGRCAAEGTWAPAALLPRRGTTCTALAHDLVSVRFSVDETPADIRIRIDAQGLPTAITLNRWGDPDGTGTWGWHAFGGDITACRTFDGVTIPAEGVFGWHHGTPRWAEGQFFRCAISEAHPY